MHADSIAIPLTRNKIAYVSREDAPRVAGKKWSALCTQDGMWYAVRFEGGVFWYLHRYLLQPVPGFEVDHIDGDGLNCTRENLRLATSAQNKHNQRLSRHNKSGYKGVHMRRDTGKWVARISVGNRTMTIAQFDSAIEAALAYDERVREIAGEFGCYNFPRDGERPVRRSSPLDRSGT